MSNNKVTDVAVQFNKQWEGLSLTAYQGKADRKGVITIGYGHTNLAGTPPVPKLGMRITEKEAEEILRRDLQKAQNVINRYVKVPLTENENAVLISFIHNLGEGAFKGSTLLKELNGGNKEKVPTELLKWVNVRINGKLTRVEGLVNRRSAEAGLWVKGKFVSSATPDVVKTTPAFLTQENVSMGTAVLSAVGANFSSGPIAWVLAAVILGAALWFGVSMYKKKTSK